VITRRLISSIVLVIVERLRSGFAGASGLSQSLQRAATFLLNSAFPYLKRLGGERMVARRPADEVPILRIPTRAAAVARERDDPEPLRGLDARPSKARR
jgi:hypothetical protein